MFELRFTAPVVDESDSTKSDPEHLSTATLAEPMIRPHFNLGWL
jgi:hypothetical protein